MGSVSWSWVSGSGRPCPPADANGIYFSLYSFCLIFPREVHSKTLYFLYMCV